MVYMCRVVLFIKSLGYTACASKRDGVEVRKHQLVHQRLPHHVRDEPFHLAYITQDMSICVSYLTLDL